MEISLINNFEAYVEALLRAGFTSNGNGDGIFSLSAYFGENIGWHTENPDTDPWEWRIRVLKERGDIAYAKIFFRKGGLITKEWYPYFLALRRKGESLEDAYNKGLIGTHAKRLYATIKDAGRLPAHMLRQYGGFSKEDAPKLERALIDLQMKMYITICGSARKVSDRGEYGWSSSVFCVTEDFFGNDIFEQAEKISESQATQAITQRILELNPSANKKKITRFITG